MAGGAMKETLAHPPLPHAIADMASLRPGNRGAAKACQGSLRKPSRARLNLCTRGSIQTWIGFGLSVLFR